MRSRLRENLPALALAAGALLAVAWLSLSSWEWTDYDAEARPAFDALLNGHLLGFLKLAPAYGGSLVIRAPFVFIPKLWGGGELSTFRAAAAPGLAATALLGLWLVGEMRARGATWIAWAAVLLLCIANPITLPALEYGHPEELLGAALCVAAVIAATRGRAAWAGALLGLAIANKEWAALAIGPVLLALPSGRVRATLVAATVAGAVLAPLILVGSAGSITHGGAANTGSLFNPWQLWWFLGSHAHPVRDLAGHVKLGYRAGPSWIGPLAHPLIVALALPLSLVCLWLRRSGARRPDHEGLLLLALVLLLRFSLDPWDFTYYPLPFLIALVTWEALTFARAPVFTLALSLVLWFVFQAAPLPGLRLAADAQALIFAAVTLPAMISLAAALYAPGTMQRFALRPKRHAAVATPA